MISIGLGHYLTLAAIIFTIGIVGLFLNRKNIIVILMSIELIREEILKLIPCYPFKLSIFSTLIVDEFR